MTFDQTKACTKELFYYPITCPQSVQGFWTYHPQHDEFPGLYPQQIKTLDYPEPAYTDCCNDPVSVQTLTTTVRKRGGIRFLAALRSTRICITIQKVTATCPGESPVPKYLFTAQQYYSGVYDYVYYDEVSTTYSLSDPSSCWVTNTNTSAITHSYPFDLSEWDGDTGTSITGITCRQLLLDEIPTSSTVLTFGSGAGLNGCTAEEAECFACDTTPLCFGTGPVGVSEPTTGFCNASTTNTVTTTTDVKTCQQHLFYFWSESDSLFNPCQYLSGYPLDFPPDQSSVCCRAFSPSSWSSVPSCTKTFSYSEVTGPGIDASCACPAIKADAPDSCYPSRTCPTCVGSNSIIQGPAANVNLPVSLPTATVRYGLECRTIGLTRSVSCSGYMEKEICFNHEVIIITVAGLEVVSP